MNSILNFIIGLKLTFLLMISGPAGLYNSGGNRIQQGVWEPVLEIGMTDHARQDSVPFFEGAGKAERAIPPESTGNRLTSFSDLTILIVL